MKRGVRKLIVVAAVVGAIAAACGGSSDGSSGERGSEPSTTAPLEDELRDGLGEFHLSRISEIPDLRAVFHHNPDGWAVEDTSLDAGATWCRHAYYRWEITEATSEDEFVVTYTTTYENPDCYPLNQPLVLQVTAREQRGDVTVLQGVYTNAGLHVERTVCDESIADWPDVCGEELPLPEPTEDPPPA